MAVSFHDREYNTYALPLLAPRHVSLVTAKALKKHGFPHGVNGVYTEWDAGFDPVWEIAYFEPDMATEGRTQYPAPDISVILRWLRQEHDILVMPEPMPQGSWAYRISSPTFGQIVSDYDYHTYEEAADEGILHVLELMGK